MDWAVIISGNNTTAREPRNEWHLRDQMARRRRHFNNGHKYLHLTTFFIQVVVLMKVKSNFQIACVSIIPSPNVCFGNSPGHSHHKLSVRVPVS